ncbi:MAG: GHMP kinase [Thermomicrobiales bacterium]|nr:MAG: GHMP kinase [Thermomicrobiales bacterium]
MPTRVHPNAAVAVAVTAPARLHMGFVDLNGSLGRKYGSLGLALEGLATHVVVRRGGAPSITGQDADRTSRYLDRLRAVIDIPGDLCVEIESAIPPHSGLGSGTQLALALGTAVSKLTGSDLSAREIAHLLDRGARSGIGIAVFEQGGFVVDGGRGVTDAPPPLISRMPFPQNWRVLLLLDPQAIGLHGQAELSAFRTLPAFPERDAERLCRELMVCALPALAEADLPTFGKAISNIQSSIGDYFSPAQGGRYTSPRIARALDFLKSRGVHCIGQSSWGPTGFAVVDAEQTAQSLLVALKSDFPDVEPVVCVARNRGGDVFVPCPMHRDGGGALARGHRTSGN